MYPGDCSCLHAQALPAVHLRAMVLHSGLRRPSTLPQASWPRPELGAALGGVSAVATGDKIKGWEDLVDIAECYKLLLPHFPADLQRLLAGSLSQ